MPIAALRALPEIRAGRLVKRYALAGLNAGSDGAREAQAVGSELVEGASCLCKVLSAIGVLKDLEVLRARGIQRSIVGVRTRDRTARQDRVVARVYKRVSCVVQH